MSQGNSFLRCKQVKCKYLDVLGLIIDLSGLVVFAFDWVVSQFLLVFCELRFEFRVTVTVIRPEVTLCGWRAGWLVLGS